jgi:hypothetical protein
MRAVKDSLDRSLQEKHEKSEGPRQDKWHVSARQGWVGEISGLFEHSVTVNVELWAEEIAMKKSRCSWLFVVGLLAAAGLFGCSQETPAEKAKAAAASGSAAVQAAGQAAVDAIQTPMDNARQVKGVLGQSAEQRAAQSKESMQ